MANVNIDTSELDDLLDNLSSMERMADVQQNTLENKLAEYMVSDIKSLIDFKFDNDADDKNQISLRESFEYNSYTYSTRIHSTAPHALPLEEGVIPHYITPDKKQALNFTPDNISDYPEEVRNDDGSVTFHQRVYWKPDRNEGGWKYVLDAQKAWDNSARKDSKILQSTRLIISSGGFR